MKNLLTLLGLCFTILCLQNCTDRASLNDYVEPQSDLAFRSGCSTISQDYVDDVRLLTASTLMVSANTVKVGAIKRVTASTGVWIEPSDVSGFSVGNPETLMFVAYVDTPLGDQEVASYSYDADFCEEPTSSKVDLGELEDLLYSTLGIFDENVDGF